MIPSLFFIFIVLSVFIAFKDWRQGIFLMLLVVALQDPIRKIMPNAPSYMVLAFIPIWLAICSRIFIVEKGAWRYFSKSMPSISEKIQLFLLAIGLALIVLYVNYGLVIWKVGLIGLISYLFPILAMIVGFYFARNPSDIKRLISIYIIITTLMLVGGALEYLELFSTWPILGTEALKMQWIRHIPGYIIKLHAGFYRSPDIQGWNAAHLTMLSLLMVLISKRLGYKTLFSIIAVWGMVILLITGRNKMIFMPGIFLIIMMSLYLFKGNHIKSFTVALSVIIIFSFFWLISTQLNIKDEYIVYTTTIGIQSAPDRLAQQGIAALGATYEQFGFFGEGLGTAATGARFGRINSTRKKTWQEGGLSRILVELGVIGFVISLLLVFSLFKAFYYTLTNAPKKGNALLLITGILGIIAANIASFVVSHQTFGDPFIVVFTSLFIGIAISAPRWSLIET